MYPLIVTFLYSSMTFPPGFGQFVVGHLSTHHQVRNGLLVSLVTIKIKFDYLHQHYSAIMLVTILNRVIEFQTSCLQHLTLTLDFLCAGDGTIQQLLLDSRAAFT